MKYIPGMNQEVIEYFYKNRQKLLAPRLDGARKFGSYGMLELSVYHFRGIYGKLYHPIDNADEAAWWLDLYHQYHEIKDVSFVPAPDQKQTRLPFEPPELEEVTDPEPPFDWYSYTTDSDEYTIGMPHPSHED